MRVVVGAAAREDIGDIISYLEREAGSLVARRYAERFRTAIAELATYPEVGAPRPTLGRSTRLIVIEPYLLFYRDLPARDEVRVLRIMHGKRKITARALRRF
jgi:toxin ParE1/3/4